MRVGRMRILSGRCVAFVLGGIGFLRSRILLMLVCRVCILRCIVRARLICGLRSWAWSGYAAVKRLFGMRSVLRRLCGVFVLGVKASLVLRSFVLLGWVGCIRRWLMMMC